jgi:hypothetical protein
MQFQQTVEFKVPSHNAYQANFTSLVDFIKQQAAVADTQEEWAAIFNSVRGIQDTICPFCGKTFGKKTIGIHMYIFANKLGKVRARWKLTIKYRFGLELATEKKFQYYMIKIKQPWRPLHKPRFTHLLQLIRNRF